MNELLPKQKERMMVSEKALLEADATQLKKLYEQAEQELKCMIDGLAVIVKHDSPSRKESDNSINAMREVSLAAIELAKIVATQKSNPLTP